MKKYRGLAQKNAVARKSEILWLQAKYTVAADEKNTVESTYFAGDLKSRCILRLDFSKNTVDSKKMPWLADSLKNAVASP